MRTNFAHAANDKRERQRPSDALWSKLQRGQEVAETRLREHDPTPILARVFVVISLPQGSLVFLADHPCGSVLIHYRCAGNPALGASP